MFVAGTEDWFVRSLAEYKYQLFLLYDSAGILVGVAGGQDGFGGMVTDVLSDLEKQKKVWKKNDKLPIYSLMMVAEGGKRTKRVEAQVAWLPKEARKDDEGRKRLFYLQVSKKASK
jgi:hypothetical protein